MYLSQIPDSKFAVIRSSGSRDNPKTIHTYLHTYPYPVPTHMSRVRFPSIVRLPLRAFVPRRLHAQSPSENCFEIVYFNGSVLF